jgi:hypothetical protein
MMKTAPEVAPCFASEIGNHMFRRCREALLSEQIPGNGLAAGAVFLPSHRSMYRRVEFGLARIVNER